MFTYSSMNIFTPSKTIKPIISSAWKRIKQPYTALVNRNNNKAMPVWCNIPRGSRKKVIRGAGCYAQGQIHSSSAEKHATQAGSLHRLIIVIVDAARVDDPHAALRINATIAHCIRCARVVEKSGAGENSKQDNQQQSAICKRAAVVDIVEPCAGGVNNPCFHWFVPSFCGAGVCSTGLQIPLLWSSAQYGSYPKGISNQIQPSSWLLNISTFVRYS